MEETEVPFPVALQRLLNKYSMEQESNTPDFILARYLNGCLNIYNETMKSRRVWFNDDGTMEERP